MSQLSAPASRNDIHVSVPIDGHPNDPNTRSSQRGRRIMGSRKTHELYRAFNKWGFDVKGYTASTRYQYLHHRS